MKIVYETSKSTEDLHVTLVRYRQLNNVAHYHNDHELVYVHQGCATVTVNGTPYTLQAGATIFIHSNDVHYISSDATTTVSVLKIDRTYAEPVFASERLISPLLSSTASPEPLLSSLRRELRERRELCEVMIGCMTTAFLVSMLREEPTVTLPPSKRTAPNEIYKDISEMIFREYATITFDKAAAYMHFSRPYFSKMFRRLFGMTFTGYLNTVRIAIAIEKLREGRMSMTQISAHCGFNTIRNFNRVFKSLTGYPPNALPEHYVFIHNLHDASGLDPTLNVTQILEP